MKSRKNALITLKNCGVIIVWVIFVHFGVNNPTVLIGSEYGLKKTVKTFKIPLQAFDCYKIRKLQIKMDSIVKLLRVIL